MGWRMRVAVIVSWRRGAATMLRGVGGNRKQNKWLKHAGMCAARARGENDGEIKRSSAHREMARARAISAAHQRYAPLIGEHISWHGGRHFLAICQWRDLPAQKPRGQRRGRPAHQAPRWRNHSALNIKSKASLAAGEIVKIGASSPSMASCAPDISPNASWRKAWWPFLARSHHKLAAAKMSSVFVATT